MESTLSGFYLKNVIFRSESVRDSSAICPPAALGLGVWPLSTRTGDSQSHAPTCVGAAAHRVEKVPDCEKVTTSDFCPSDKL